MPQPPEPRTAELQASLKDLQRQFLASVKDVRPRLHRFCARMCGSALDGEDVVQEALAQAFYRLPTLQDESRLEAWLFRIAHRKCVDFLRAERKLREETVPYDDERDEDVRAAAQAEEPIDETLAPLVGELPPKERASVVLKDILQYSLAEVAEVVDSTVGGVKAALHRGRARLRARAQAPAPVDLDRRQRELLAAYVDCFNRRDWDALQQLVARDARLEVVERGEGPLGKTYFGNYASLPWEWKMSLARVDGEPLIVHWRRAGGDWRPHSVIRLWWRGEQVVRIRDYVHIDYILQDAHIEGEEP